MIEQGYNDLDGSMQNMTEFFETKIKNLESFGSSKGFSKSLKGRNNKKRKHPNQEVSEKKFRRNRK